MCSKISLDLCALLPFSMYRQIYFTFNLLVIRVDSNLQFRFSSVHNEICCALNICITVVLTRIKSKMQRITLQLITKTIGNVRSWLCLLVERVNVACWGMCNGKEIYTILAVLRFMYVDKNHFFYDRLLSNWEWFCLFSLLHYLECFHFNLVWLTKSTSTRLLNDK